jgi:hypothetical protein
LDIYRAKNAGNGIESLRNGRRLGLLYKPIFFYSASRFKKPVPCTGAIISFFEIRNLNRMFHVGLRLTLGINPDLAENTSCEN